MARLTMAEPAKSVSIRIWEQDGAWEWDIRWAAPPKTRSTGRRRTLPETVAEVCNDVLADAKAET